DLAAEIVDLVGVRRDGERERRAERADLPNNGERTAHRYFFAAAGADDFGTASLSATSCSRKSTAGRSFGSVVTGLPFSKPTTLSCSCLPSGAVKVRLDFAVNLYPFR